MKQLKDGKIVVLKVQYGYGDIYDYVFEPEFIIGDQPKIGNQRQDYVYFYNPTNTNGHKFEEGDEWLVKIISSKITGKFVRGRHNFGRHKVVSVEVKIVRRKIEIKYEVRYPDDSICHKTTRSGYNKINVEEIPVKTTYHEFFLNELIFTLRTSVNTDKKINLNEIVMEETKEEWLERKQSQFKTAFGNKIKIDVKRMLSKIPVMPEDHPLFFKASTKV